ncbi:epithelial cell-transforming sequence 2 oncogene-like [Trichosurus vulpecula]|uniref:epithelial cell-transforming sequence 2 oncogene-like n=1 Tax=Trichosurus vulpecula TaxID=9337 RepID=UPI00186AC80B|nr:epithelial cell-transforming sequence 2 oncogene-like [Trichosurus vulpecula]
MNREIFAEMSVRDSSNKSQGTECFQRRFSAWTPIINKPLNKQLFQERVSLITHWFDLWTDKQRKEFLLTILQNCCYSQLKFVKDWFSEKMPVVKVDFCTVLPRFISLYIFSFLNPMDLCAAAQVNWPWKFLTEQDCLWRPKCIRFGWFLPYDPPDNEYGAWKHHYIACVATLDWLTPREASAIYGTLNEPKSENEEQEERQKERRLRKIIWRRLALHKRELFKVRPPWMSGTCCSTVLKSRCQPQLPQVIKDRIGLSVALEKQLVLASLEALPKKKNVSGSHSYPLLSNKRYCRADQKYGSFSHSLQTSLVLISSRIPAYEMVVDSVKTGVIPLVYEYTGLTLESLLLLVEKVLDGRDVQSIGIFSDGDSREINLLQGYTIGVENVLTPEVRDFWEKLGSYVATQEEGGHVDIFVPLAASEAGTKVLSQLSQLTGTMFSSPTGIATGSYQHILSDWLGQKQGTSPPSIYFCDHKLQTWHSFTEFLEETLKSVRKQLRPHFEELQRTISGKILGQFMFDSLSLANVLANQETAQVLADGLIELSKEKSENPLEYLAYFLLKKSSKKNIDFDGNFISTKCDATTFSLLTKERNMKEDHSQDRKTSISEDDLKLEMLINLERKLQMDLAEKRTRIAGELLKSERTYVQMLETVRDVYVTPLKAALASNRAILSSTDVQIIFSDILGVLDLNRHFLRELTERLQEWGPAQCLGEIFIKFGLQLKTYTNFFNNYPIVLKTIEKCREMIPSFRAFLKRQDKTIVTRMMSLQELLLYPPRRFEEYINLLYGLRLHTPSEHVDRGDLTTAIKQMKRYIGYINQLKQNVNRKDQLSDIERSICGCPTLSESNRFLIRVQDVAQLRCCNEKVSFSLRLYEHIRDLSLFLFNDSLLVSHQTVTHTPFERTTQTTYQFLTLVALHRLLIEDIPDSKYIKNAFVLQGPKCQWICSTVNEDKLVWLSVLQSAVRSSIEKYG